MKHIILYPLIGLAFCIGCSSNLPEEDGTALRLHSVTLPESAETKAIVTSINNVDVYVTKQADGSDYLAGTSFLKFTKSGGSWNPDKDLEITNDNGVAKVYGSYPSDAETTITNDGAAPKISVTLLDSDDFSGTAQNDYLYATPVENVSASSRTVNLAMNHALAKISFRVSKASGVTEEMTLKAIDIVSRNNRLQKGEGTMLLTDGTLNVPQTDSLHLTGSVQLVVGQATTNAYCLAAPMKGAETSLSFSLHVTVGTEERVFTTAPVNGAVQWVKGKEYTYVISINKMSGTLTDVSINPWQTDASPNTSIGI